MTQKVRLTKDKWLAAGFHALAHNGPSALRAEALARELGTTKGSFYWHFADLAAYKTELLALWKEKVAIGIIRYMDALTDPKARLAALVETAVQPPPEDYGGRLIEPAMRAWALTDEDVMAELTAIDLARLSFVERLFAELGVKNPVMAQVFYGAYIGLDDLAAKQGLPVAPALDALLKAVLPEDAATSPDARGK